MVELREDYLDKVIDQAKQSEAKFQHGALVINDRGHVVGASPNLEKTHPVQARYAKRAKQPKRESLHAEIRALLDARGDGKTLIVCRINRRGELRDSKPCPVCQLAIEDTGIERVIYSTSNGWEEL